MKPRSRPGGRPVPRRRADRYKLCLPRQGMRQILGLYWFRGCKGLQPSKVGGDQGDGEASRVSFARFVQSQLWDEATARKGTKINRIFTTYLTSTSYKYNSGMAHHLTNTGADADKSISSR